MKKNIYHILPANIYHITPQLIRSIMSKTPDLHYFILIGKKSDLINWDIYKTLFFELKISNYKLVDGFSNLRFEDVDDYKSFIILHSDSIPWKMYFLYKNYKNVHWVCWGSGTKVLFKIKSLLSWFLKFILYMRLKSIITLSSNDAINLKKYFHIKSIEQISYIDGVNDLYVFNRDALCEISKEVVSVFIGNNSTCIKSYLPLLKILEKFSNSCTVTAMLNYDLLKDNTYNHLVEFGKLKFQDNFTTDEKLYELKDFPKYMNSCDIYICSVEEQTGLGAIYAALKLGKKLFLAGNNYKFLTSLGCKVNHVDELKLIAYDGFAKPLPLIVQYQNFDIISDYLSVERLREKWKLFYQKYTPN
jgi:hypothetical protein